MWVLGIALGSFGKYPVLLTVEQSLQHLFFISYMILFSDDPEVLRWGKLDLPPRGKGFKELTAISGATLKAVYIFVCLFVWSFFFAVYVL